MPVKTKVSKKTTTSVYNVGMPYISKNRQQQIDNVIQDIQLRTGLYYPDDTLVDLFNALGIAIYALDFAQYSDNVDGYIEYENKNKDKPEIYINERFSPTRKSFTLAHELGHFLLHNDGTKKHRVDAYNYSGTDPQRDIEETEANYFAASLLVPKPRLLKLLHLAGENHKILAEYFGVSQPVIVNRLKWLRNNNQLQ